MNFLQLIMLAVSIGPQAAPYVQHMLADAKAIYDLWKAKQGGGGVTPASFTAGPEIDANHEDVQKLVQACGQAGVSCSEAEAIEAVQAIKHLECAAAQA